MSSVPRPSVGARSRIWRWPICARRGRGGAGTLSRPVRGRAQHDRRHGRPATAGRAGRSGGGRRTRRLPSTLGGRVAGARQVVLGPGLGPAPGCPGAGDGAPETPGLQRAQSQPRARPGQHLQQRQSGALPCRRWGRLSLPGRPGAGTRSGQSAAGRAAAQAAGALAPVRPRASDADAVRTGARAGSRDLSSDVFEVVSKALA
jgi:hypothetical protein